MRLPSHALLTLMLGVTPIALLPAAALAQDCTCPSPGIRAEVAPPPLPDYDQPPLPAASYIWTPGYWSWNNIDYYWVPGTWVRPPRSGLLWTPGYWRYDSNTYVFTAGYWGEHVGFYGGVPYGYGYAGIGYQGGYWTNNVFFYNRNANNFGTVNVTNVYEKTIVVDKTVIVNRVSYNGGSGGITLRPTSQDDLWAREEHVPPTQVQAEHLRAASTNSSLFARANHGEPVVAATSRAGTFAGEGVIAAKAAGAASRPAVEPAKPQVGAVPDQNALRGEMVPIPEGAKPEAAKPEAVKPEAARPAPVRPEANAWPGEPPVARKPPPDKIVQPGSEGQRPMPPASTDQKRTDAERMAPRPPSVGREGEEHTDPGEKPRKKLPDEK